jgi:hypothetical protein
LKVKKAGIRNKHQGTLGRGWRNKKGICFDAMREVTVWLFLVTGLLRMTYKKELA